MHILCLWCLISTRLADEKAALLKQCEESVSAKVEEAEQLKLQLEEAQQELLLTKNQVCFTGMQQKLILNQIVFSFEVNSTFVDIFEAVFSDVVMDCNIRYNIILLSKYLHTYLSLRIYPTLYLALEEKQSLTDYF